jgi:hypothetical protein
LSFLYEELFSYFMLLWMHQAILKKYTQRKNTEFLSNTSPSYSHLSSNGKLWIAILCVDYWAGKKSSIFWWFTPVILATQEGDLGTISVWGQPGKLRHLILTIKTGECLASQLCRRLR